MQVLGHESVSCNSPSTISFFGFTSCAVSFKTARAAGKSSSSSCKSVFNSVSVTTRSYEEALTNSDCPQKVQVMRNSAFLCFKVSQKAKGCCPNLLVSGDGFT